MTVVHEVSLTIYGSQFTLRTDDDPEVLRSLAAQVEREMQRVAEESGIMQGLRVAILTALHLAAEVQRLRSGDEHLETQVGAFLDRLEPLLDEAVGSDA